MVASFVVARKTNHFAHSLGMTKQQVPQIGRDSLTAGTIILGSRSYDPSGGAALGPDKTQNNVNLKNQTCNAPRRIARYSYHDILFLARF